jgi:hypothetical protein
MTIHVAPSIITDRSPGRPAKAARTAAEARARMRRDVVVCWSPPAGSYAMQLNTDSCSAEHDWPSHSTFLKNGRPEPQLRQWVLVALRIHCSISTGA